MKRSMPIWSIAFATAWIFGTAWARAQSESDLYGRAAAARMDLAVPDAPAFSILDVQPTSIMRPSSLREVSILVSQFLEGGSTLPQSLALELAPALLIKGSDLPLRQYQKNAWLYRTRVSVASQPGPGGGTDLATGIRFTLIDKSDLRTDTLLLHELYEIGRRINEVEAEAKLKFRGNPGVYESLPAGERQVIDARMKSFVDSVMGDRADRRIIQTRQEAKLRLWNAQILEVGLAAKANAPDSLFRSLRAIGYGAWLTWGLPLGQPGLILLAGNGKLERNSADKLELFSGAVAVRAYYGSETYKGYLEAGDAWGSEFLPQITASLGGELRLFGGFWLDASVGLESYGGQGTSVHTAWNIRFATPELGETK